MSLGSDLRNTFSHPKDALRNYFAQRVVYAWEVPSIMRKHIYTGAMGSIYFTLMGGLFFVYFGNSIGMSRFQWGLMGGIASFALASQIASALMTERLGKRKLIWFWAAFAGRALRVAGILFALALWHRGHAHASWVLMFVVAASNFFDAFAGPPWLSWLADIIPERQHGRFWGRRSAWIALANVCVLVPAGFFMDRSPEEWKVATATIIFMAAGVIGLLDLVIHGTLPEPELLLPKENHVRARLTAPLFDREFRPWLVFNLCWTFSMTLGGSLATLYFLDELGIKRNFLGGTIVLSALPLVGSIITGRWSGKLVDKAGTKRVLYWGHIFWGTLPFFWLVSSPGTALWILTISSVLGGTSSTAASNAANKIITRLPAAENRAMYVAVSACLGSLAGGVAVLTAGTVLKVLGDWQWEVFGWPVTAFKIIFISSLVLRLTSALTLIGRINEPQAAEDAEEGRL